jgi:hypothetical protein
MRLSIDQKISQYLAESASKHDATLREWTRKVDKRE